MRDTAAAAIGKGLIALSRSLGAEERGLALLGEGNTSADCGDGTFFVKASGSSLASLDEDGISRVRLTPILALLEGEAIGLDAIERELLAARVDPSHKKPSVETFFHAACLTDGGARWVAHTHSTALNQIVCSRLGAQPFLRHVFPDAIVVCGKVPAVVPYLDPGFALAQAIQAELRRYRGAHGQPPKLVLLENHGSIALGQSAREALSIALMAEKWATVLQGTYALGGPRYLPETEVDRIDGRSDEHYRRRALSHEESGASAGRSEPAGADG